MTYHASRLGYGTARVRRYDWAEVQRYYDGHDNRLENLQLLCPNCHSQTENFAGRNASRTGNGAADAIL